MEIIKLSASKRTEQGKGPSRRLRVEGKIPAIAYGGSLAALSIAVSPKELGVALSGVHGRNSVVELDIDGSQKITAMVREYAHHPVTRAILHADFLQVDLTKPVDVEVPFKLIGKSKGVVLGGILAQVFRTLPVRCVPEKIPALIELDVTELGLNESFKASQLKLPEGVEVRLAQEQTIAVVNAPEKKTEAEIAAEAAPKGAPAAGAAPAAAAAAPAKAEKKKK
jgi:large subunit ribosomal protein L25